jgi:hypothetical protein
MTSINPPARSAAPLQTEYGPDAGAAPASASSTLGTDFERRLDRLRSSREPGARPRHKGDEESTDVLAPAVEAPAARASSTPGAAAQVERAAGGALPGLSVLEFAAALDRLQAPLPTPGVPAQWDFTLDSRHAPLQALRVTEIAGGGWNVWLKAAPLDRPLLAARIERLRARLAGRAVSVGQWLGDESER